MEGKTHQWGLFSELSVKHPTSIEFQERISQEDFHSGCQPHAISRPASPAYLE
jgi:hypothetical protein